MIKEIDIEQLKREYKNRFSESWIANKDWNPANEKNSYSECKKLIDDYSELLFVIFSYSILGGEFIIKKDKIEGTIKYLLNITTKEYGSPIATASALEAEIIDEFDILNKNIKLACLAYRSIITTYPLHYNTTINNYRFQIYQAEKLKWHNKIYYFNKFIVNVCRFDLYFVNNDDLLDNLIILNKEISDIEEKETSEDIKNVFNICTEKINLLIKKLLTYSGPSIFSINFTEYQLTYQDVKLKYFDPIWKQYELFSAINNVTSLSDNPLIKKYESNSFQDKSTFSELILLMRAYCKDPKSSKEQIRNIFSEFNKKYNSYYKKGLLLDFDRNALDSMKNVVYNCRFSYYLQQKDYTIKRLKKDMEKIESFQCHTGAHNYFHFQIAIEYLLKKAKEKVSLKNLREIKELLNNYIEGYKRTINQCQKDMFYPLQLMFDECLFYIKDLDKTVFIASSFSQPANYKLLKEKADDYRIGLFQIENKLDLLEEQETIDELKNNLEATTSKYIEIGGIFVAVLSLLFSVVSFTDTRMDIKDITLHSLGMSYILLIFISCIYVLTLKKDSKISDYFKTFRFWFFFVLFILSIIFLYFIIM